MGDVIDINQSTVISVLELLDIKNKKEVFLDVLNCFRIDMELAHEFSDSHSRNTDR